MDDYLTADELALLTGYKRRADQVRGLTERGWVFEIARGGRPVVLCACRDARMGGEPMAVPVVAVKKHNIEALRQVRASRRRPSN
jgi:hypothetical protein